MRTLVMFTLALMLTTCNHPDNEIGKVEIADSTLCQLGEGAFWDGAFNRLFYIDITGQKLFEYHPDSGIRKSFDMPSMIGTVVVQDAGHVVVALTDGIYRFDLMSHKLELLVRPVEHTDSQRFNDGKCDPEGRFWVGSMSLGNEEKKSFLYRIDHDLTATPVLDGITISNGIVWNSSSDKMYYIDTPTRMVKEFDFDRATGNISNERIAVVVEDSLGFPDGMTIDSEDKLWIAMWGGSAVCCFDPESGQLLERLAVPAKNVTSCAFGGPERNILYITTAENYGDAEADRLYPNAGALFKVKTPFTGAQFKNYINYIN